MKLHKMRRNCLYGSLQLGTPAQVDVEVEEDVRRRGGQLLKCQGHRSVGYSNNDRHAKCYRCSRALLYDWHKNRDLTFPLIQVAFLNQPNMATDQSWFCGFQTATRECIPNDSYRHICSRVRQLGGLSPKYQLSPQVPIIFSPKC